MFAVSIILIAETGFLPETELEILRQKYQPRREKQNIDAVREAFFQYRQLNKKYFSVNVL